MLRFLESLWWRIKLPFAIVIGVIGTVGMILSTLFLLFG